MEVFLCLQIYTMLYMITPICIEYDLKSIIFFIKIGHITTNNFCIGTFALQSFHSGKNTE